MKNFSGFKYQKSVLRTVEEPPRKKPFNWDRFLFLSTLFFILLYFGKKTFQNVVYITVDGQVLMEKLNVQFTDNIRIRNMQVEEAEMVCEGDTLFQYAYENDDLLEEQKEIKLAEPVRKGNDQRNWFLREVLRLKQEIAIKGSSIRLLRKRLKWKESELEEQTKQILVGVDVAHKLPPLRTSIAQLQGEIIATKDEVWLLKQHLKDIEQQANTFEAQMDSLIVLEQKSLTLGQADQMYVSPIEGRIGRIFISPNEVCYESESVMTIHQLNKLKIRAYFVQEAHKKVSEGDEVTIIFPDGTQSQGYIHNFYVSTYPLPPEFQKKHESTTRSIVADIYPKDLSTSHYWSAYYKMSVKVIKQKGFSKILF